MSLLLSRRVFFASAAAAALAVSGLKALQPRRAFADDILRPDPQGLLDLPDGFSYKIVSRTGDAMADGFITPARPDGMGAFALGPDLARAAVVRNHEIRPGDRETGPFGERDELAARLSADKIFDRDARGRPLSGGTTTFVWNTKTQSLEKDYLSLAGTATNCAGGVTPWGSWLTCEETLQKPGKKAGAHHGFVFEVPADADGPVTPVALKDMGRFKHEAASVDPASGVVYLTEDDRDGLFYRFLPNVKGDFAKGGRLQALAIKGTPGADTRNWGRNDFPVGAAYDVTWIDLDDVEAPDGDLKDRGFVAGAAKFARGEGLCPAKEAEGLVFYFTCTSGGAKKLGQIWRYVPSPVEGGDESGASGRVSLFYESDDAAAMERCDNIVAAPTGHLVVCEDGGGDNFLRALSPDGRIAPLARTSLSELCGACFSPDGTTLFVNIQVPGITLAITGPWAQMT